MLRVRGKLELDPPEYVGFWNDYKLVRKHEADGALIAPGRSPLPPGVQIGDASCLNIGEDLLTLCGWYSETGDQTTIHIPRPVHLMSREWGLLKAQVSSAAAAAAR